MSVSGRAHKLFCAVQSNMVIIEKAAALAQLNTKLSEEGRAPFDASCQDMKQELVRTGLQNLNYYTRAWCDIDLNGSGGAGGASGVGGGASASGGEAAGDTVQALLPWGLEVGIVSYEPDDVYAAEMVWNKLMEEQTPYPLGTVQAAFSMALLALKEDADWDILPALDNT